ncbi:hypothetical protein IHV25_01965 [Phaeovibrio sulfidiphilus]|uniref:Uncharacterized protein n=1 Tax=Phaeovibrio sulfidiphilus TaxID=1220600 RepID=A0A8J7CQ35_9PROT|nr:hypothetical protein [Phaeovibrio sulfidiphilus]MBE1236420.1 hypothetical protein [Phaeovibrio sulfidiphilus]
MSDPSASSQDPITTLFTMLAQAFEAESEDLARALEDGSLALEMSEDDEGGRFVEATWTRGGTPRVARVYRDRVLREKSARGDRPA